MCFATGEQVQEMCAVCVQKAFMGVPHQECNGLLLLMNSCLLDQSWHDQASCNQHCNEYTSWALVLLFQLSGCAEVDMFVWLL